MSVKLVKAVTRSGDGVLVENGGSGNTIADTFLARGWTILGVFRGDSSNEVAFVLQQVDAS
jgi:hypothetical protein